MGIGAVFGAILTMYTAVATRAREIATLRALGFNTSAVLVSVLGESLVLGAIGGVIGGLAAYLGFNGYQTSTMNFQTFSQVAFAFRVTPELLGDGTLLRAGDGPHRRTLPGDSRGAAADSVGAAGAVELPRIAAGQIGLANAAMRTTVLLTLVDLCRADGCSRRPAPARRAARILLARALRKI